MNKNILQSINILYLEDDNTVRESIARTLKLISKNVYDFPNPIEALEYFKGDFLNIDIIITDIRMPKMDGLEFVAKLRENDLNIPVFITTAFDEKEFLEKSIELKVNKFLKKPINLKNFIDDLEQILEVIIVRKEEQNEKLQTLNKTLNLLNNKIYILLNNLETGIVSFNKFGVIQSEYSKKVKEFLNCKDLENKKIQEILFAEESTLKKLFIKGIDYIQNDTNIMNIELYLGLLPQYIQLNNSYFALQYKYLENDDIMLIMSNITETKNLKKQIEQTKYKNELVVGVVSNKRDFIDIKNSFELFNKKSTIVMIEDDEQYFHLLHELHTYKGLFSQVNFILTAQKIEELENDLKVSIRSYNIDSNKIYHTYLKHNIFDTFEKELENVIGILGYEFFDNYEEQHKEKIGDLLLQEIEQLKTKTSLELKKEIQSIENKATQLNYVQLRSLLLNLTFQLPKLASKFDKLISKPIISGKESIMIPRNIIPFIHSLVHIYRNSIDHGIEDQNTRYENKKNQYGTIKTHYELLNGILHITIKDDGQGIDIDKVINKIIKNCIFTREYIETLTHQEKLQLIFYDRITTCENVTSLSGQGVGLSATKEYLKSLDGSVIIHSKLKHGTTFEFSIPLEQKINQFQIAQNLLQKKFENYIESTLGKSVEVLKAQSSNEIQWDTVVKIPFSYNEKQFEVIMAIQKTLLIEISKIIVPDGFHHEEMKAMQDEVPLDMINTFVGLVIDDFDKHGCKNTNMGLPEILSKEKATKYFKMLNNTQHPILNTRFGKASCYLHKT